MAEEKIRISDDLMEDLRKESSRYTSRGQKSPSFGAMLHEAWRFMQFHKSEYPESEAARLVELELHDILEKTTQDLARIKGEIEELRSAVEAALVLLKHRADAIPTSSEESQEHVDARTSREVIADVDQATKNLRAVMDRFASTPRKPRRRTS